jgi:hypothetical protein
MAKKQATPAKAPLSTRFGRLVAKHGPGTAVKLGRLSKKAGSGIASSASKFKDGFVQGWEEV